MQVKRQPPEYLLLHRIADSAAIPIQRSLVQALKGILSPDDLKRLRAALRRRDIDGVIRIIEAERVGVLIAPVLDRLERVHASAAAASLPAFQTVLRARGVPDQSIALFGTLTRVNPASLAWIAQHGGEMVQAITTEQKLALRFVLDRGFREGVPPLEMSRQIERFVGLDKLQTRAAVAFEARLIEAGATATEARKAGTRYAALSRRRRAIKIARTETIRAANRGQLSIWERAADRGLIDRSVTLEAWIVTPDDRLCPICAPLAGQTRPLAGTFGSTTPSASGTGRAVFASTPPIHPHCRCALELVFVDDPGVVIDDNGILQSRGAL
ncbi:MAG: phage minor head protein, partial [Desulfuromonadales bacterium]|nr:phage minor head protein [Desulfuromonadales bacterium]